MHMYSFCERVVIENVFLRLGCLADVFNVYCSIISKFYSSTQIILIG